MTADHEKVVAVRRTLAADRAFLFAAWTDPALFARWFGPKAWVVDRCEVDARVGGHWRAWFRRGDGAEVYAGGTYLEFHSPTRLVFTWDLDSGGAPQDTLSVVTVIFSDAAAGTEIAITHRKLGAAQAIEMDAGWANTLDALAEFVAEQSHLKGDLG